MTNLRCSLRRDESVSSARRSFTLVELIVVLTIIFVLTGLVFTAAGFIAKKGASSRAESEMAALAAAIENYKSDSGNYPRDPGTGSPNSSTTDNLDPADNKPQVRDPTSDDYQNASRFLYGQLSGDYDPNASKNSSTNYDYVIDGNEATNRVYFNFPPGMLSITTNATASGPTIKGGGGGGGNSSTYYVNFVRDPFGYPYGYSTARQAWNGVGNNPPGYNPTYDMWSTAGSICQNCAGKPTEKCCTVAQSQAQSQWIKNW